MRGKIKMKANQKRAGARQMAKPQRQRLTLKTRVRQDLERNKLCAIAFDELEKDVEVQALLEDSN
ncbi:MAG: hypothetical protein ACW98J_04110, partial [Candidatus Thorarchaeota archaeon]